MSTFIEKIQQACQGKRSLLCVGLDPDPELMPVQDVIEFNKGIIDATSAVACAYKPNLAFYEAFGVPGMLALEKTISYIRDNAVEALIIGDAKLGDIGPSAKAYAKAMFEVWGFDAVTVNAWGGTDSIEPFLEYQDRGVFVWCRGSNPGAGDFQDLKVGGGVQEMPLYEQMALACGEWNTRGNIGLVVGATVPDQLASIRHLCPTMPLLVPGVGAQGGDLEAAVRAGTDENGRMAIINASRSVIYAGQWGAPTGKDNSAPRPNASPVQVGFQADYLLSEAGNESDVPRLNAPSAEIEHSGLGKEENSPKVFIAWAAGAGYAALKLRNAINDVLEADGKGWPTN